jgi:hypothetical protein
MKIAIIGTSRGGGSQTKLIAIKNFLQARNHSIDVFQLPGKGFASKMWYRYNSLRARFQGDETRVYARKMRAYADKLEGRIKGKYDVVIGIDALHSYVLTRELGALKIFNCESLQTDELYFSKAYGNLEDVHNLRKMELEILMKSDYVLFPWETTENYVRKCVLNGDNFVTVKYGCYPQKTTATYFFPVSIASMGSLWGQWSNKELLSRLTYISPYSIDIYGRPKPESRYNLRYKGFAPSLDILYNYQFGLNTVSNDIFRRNHHASRIMSYLAYGLPVLSPDWMKFSHELRGCLPYNEENFVDLIDEYSDRDKWERLSKEAHGQACELDWSKTLEPLEKLIKK